MPNKFYSNMSGLNKFVQGISDKHMVRLGILGEKVNRKSKDSSLTNSELGVVHEFGSPTRGIPKRSFLRAPLELKSANILRVANRGAKKLLAEGNFMQVLRNLGAAAYDVVDDAFSSGGYGTWPPNSYRTLLGKLKGNLEARRQKAAEVIYEGANYGKTLVRTGQLRRSISFDVVEKQEVGK